LGSTVYVVRIG